MLGLALGGTMKLKKLAALVLAGVLCLTAFTGCGANADDTIATLGDEKISYGVANFMCKYQKAALDDLYTAYFGASVWDTDLYGYGTTMEDDLKTYVMDTLHEMYTLKAHMDEYNVTITDEEMTKIKEAAAAFMAANSKEALEELGATEEIVIEALTLYTIEVKMYNAITSNANADISDEEANMRGYSVLTMDLKGTYDQTGTLVPYTDEEIAKIKEDALQMNLDLKAMTLEEVAESYGYKVTAGTYSTYEETTLDKALVEALAGLEEGKVSDMIETADAIYFVRVDADTDEDATEAKREQILQQRKSDLYAETLAKWQENDGWKVNESVLEKIDFHNKFTTVTESTESVGGTESIDGTESE